MLTSALIAESILNHGRFFQTFHWNQIDEAVAILKKPPEPKPTESQKFWRMVFELDNSPYDIKRKEAVNLKPIGRAVHELFNDPVSYWRNRDQHKHDIDKGIRGRELDPANVRLQRAAMLFLVGVTFSAWDMVSGKVVIDPLFDGWLGKDWKNDNTAIGVWAGWIRKFFETINDKYASDLANWGAEKLAGKRTTSTHELPDKANDMITTGFSELFDKVNGSVLESLMRISYQAPMWGAVSERVLTSIKFNSNKRWLSA